MKKHITILALIIFSIMLFKPLLKNRFIWHKSDKVFVIGHVNDKEYRGAGPSSNKYSFKLNGNQYQGIGWGTTNIEQGKYYIIVVAEQKPLINDVKIEYPIDPKSLVPQPPEGWIECPINEDGTIKENYKRKSLNGKTEENNIKGIEFSAKDSAQVTKESIEFLKKHN